MSEGENCQVEPLEKPLNRDALATAVVAYLEVSGMGCMRCAVRVRNGLLSLDGVLLAEVNLENGFAAAAIDPLRVRYSDLIAAVVGAGNDGRHHYHAKFIKLVPIEGS